MASPSPQSSPIPSNLPFKEPGAPQRQPEVLTISPELTRRLEEVHLILTQKAGDLGITVGEIVRNERFGLGGGDIDGGVRIDPISNQVRVALTGPSYQRIDPDTLKRIENLLEGRLVFGNPVKDEHIVSFEVRLNETH